MAAKKETYAEAIKRLEGIVARILTSWVRI